MLLAGIIPAAAQALTTGTEIYGYLSYYPDETGTYDRLGWYSIGIDGALTSCWTTPEDEIGNGFIADGKLYTYNEMNIMGESYGMIFKIYNLETGAIEKSVNIDGKLGFLGFDSMCYIPDEHVAYGYVRTDYYAAGMGCEQAFCRIDIANPTAITIVKKVNSSIDRCVSLALNPDDGKIYGITRFGTFVNVAKDGAQTVLGDLKLLDGTSPSGLSAGLVYDNVKKVFIWNALEKGSTRDSYAASYLYTLEPQTRAMGRVCTYKGNERFTFFALAEKAVTGTPGKATIDSNTFSGTANLSGSFSLTMPTLYADGSAISPSTPLELIAKVDDTVVSATTHKAGEKMQVSFGPLAQGMHNFAFNVKTGDEIGAASVLSLYIGNDTPVAPASVRFNALGISWQASSGSVHGGYVDTEAITYTVSVDGKEIASGVRGTKVEYKVPAGPLAAHTASVVAVCNGMESEAAVSNSFVAGNPLELPVSFVPTFNESLLFTLCDANRDGNGWRFSEPYLGDPYFVFQADGKVGDDWIFLPATVFSDTEMIYRLSFDARRGDTNVPEKLEAFLATSPDPNTVIKEIMAETGPATYDYETLSSEFTVPEAGTYYVGIHACGDTDAYFLFVNHFKVSALRSAGAAPAAVSNLRATAASGGALEVEVSFTMPVLTTTGAAIADGTELVAMVTTGVASVEVKGKPGRECSTSVAIINGVNTVSVQVSEGNLSGEIVTIDVYGGLDNPKCVENLVATVSEDNLSAYLRWEAPTEGEHGGYVKPDGVKYWLIKYVKSEYAEYPVKDREIGTDVFEYTYNIPQGSALQTVRIGILAENEIAEAEYFGTLNIMMGTPYALPMDEMFAGRDLRYAPITVVSVSEEYDAYWGVDDPAIFGDGYANMSGKALIATPDRATSKGRVALPKFKVGESSAELAFSFFANDKMPVSRIYVQSAGMVDPVEAGILDASGKTGWTMQKLTLPEDFKAAGWVGVFIDVEFSSLDQALLVERYQFSERENSGTDEIEAADNVAPVYYNLQGVRVQNPENGVYIVKRGNKVSKEFIR